MVCSDFYKSEHMNKFLEPICKVANYNKIKNITIPLLEQSSIEDDEIANKFMESFYPYTERFKNINCNYGKKDGIEQVPFALQQPGPFSLKRRTTAYQVTRGDKK